MVDDLCIAAHTNQCYCGIYLFRCQIYLPQDFAWICSPAQLLLLYFNHWSYYWSLCLYSAHLFFFSGRYSKASCREGEGRRTRRVSGEPSALPNDPAWGPGDCRLTFNLSPLSAGVLSLCQNNSNQKMYYYTLSRFSRLQRRGIHS